MSGGAGLLALLAAVFAAWVLTLALIWRIFRSWQYLVDLGSLPGSGAGGAVDRPGRKDAAAWDAMTRGEIMALRARIVLFGLPPGSGAEMARHARAFRVSVLGLFAVSCGIVALVVALEPALWGAARIFLIGLAVWAGMHGLMLLRFGPGRARA